MKLHEVFKNNDWMDDQHQEDVDARASKIQRDCRALHHERDIATEQLKRLARSSPIGNYQRDPRYIPLKRKISSLTKQIANLNVEFRKIEKHMEY